MASVSIEEQERIVKEGKKFYEFLMTCASMYGLLNGVHKSQHPNDILVAGAVMLLTDAISTIADKDFVTVHNELTTHVSQMLGAELSRPIKERIREN